jgi:hypothetical protein
MTDPSAREIVESSIRALCNAGDRDKAATLIVQSYG